MPTPFPFTPVERAAHARLTPERQRAFIDALARTGLVGEAAREVGVSVAGLEKLRYAKGAEGFRKAWDAARGCDTAREARRAARRASRPSPQLYWTEPPSEVSANPDASCWVPQPHQQKWGAVLRPDEVGSAPAPEGPLRCRSARPSRRTSYLAFAADPPSPDDPLLNFTPFEHKAPRRNSITPPRQRAFIAALAATGSVTQAAREIGASLEALYRLRARGGAEGFARAWDKAVDLGMARLEDTALIRAMEGDLRPVVSGGKVVAWYRRHNDALTMFMLRHRRAHRYGSDAERAEANGPDEQEIIDSINRKLDLMRARMEGREGIA
ncbi:hypothetical protein [Croceicoccus sediminis]|uniref:hypothetical protein n=1 Tax=Croceicoccus sediminis TaxID=2571150 RepID=UPI001F0F86A8|nr:hypothetical protein [Croceicoccus sediminis]